MQVLWSPPGCVDVIDQGGMGVTVVVRSTRVPLTVALDFLRRGMTPDEVARMLGLPVEHTREAAALRSRDLTRLRWMERGIFSSFLKGVSRQQLA